jgi:hypothetical protein
MQWVQGISQINVNFLNNAKREASRHFRNIKEYLKTIIEELCLTETYSRVRVRKNLSDMFPVRNALK